MHSKRHRRRNDFMNLVVSISVLVVAFNPVLLRQLPAAVTHADHLVPLSNDSDPTYRRLYEKKLFVTPGGIARAVQLPSDAQTEAAVSVYTRETLPSHQSRQEYWVTTTEASARLWDCLPSGDEKFTGRHLSDPRKIRTLRSDAKLPRSTAIAIQQVWLEMLRATRPDPCVQCVSTDSSVEVFSASEVNGKELVAQAPAREGQDTVALVKLAFALMRYTRTQPSDQPALAKKIEKDAHALLRRLSRQ